MSNLDPQISKLLQLKRHEQPEEGFVEDFLKEFQQRQRGELLQKSSIALFRERFQQWLADSSAPVWAGAAVTAAVVAVIGLSKMKPAVAYDGLTTVDKLTIEQGGASFPIELESNPFGSAENVQSVAYYDALPVATVTSFEF